MGPTCAPPHLKMKPRAVTRSLLSPIHLNHFHFLSHLRSLSLHPHRRRGLGPFCSVTRPARRRRLQVLLARPRLGRAFYGGATPSFPAHGGVATAAARHSSTELPSGAQIPARCGGSKSCRPGGARTPERTQRCANSDSSARVATEASSVKPPSSALDCKKRSS